MDRMTMKIGGMSCGHCVSSVDKALKKLDGVQVESVAIGTATVSYDPSAVSEQRITDAVADEGYSVVETTH
jgi:copper chaperone